MQLITIGRDGKVHVRDGVPRESRPVSQAIMHEMFSRRDSPEEAERIEAMHRKQLMDAAILGPMPVGGEDAYIAAKKK